MSFTLDPQGRRGTRESPPRWPAAGSPPVEDVAAGRGRSRQPSPTFFGGRRLLE